MMSNVIEIVNFKLAETTQAAEFVAANDALQQFLNNQTGVLYRSLAKQQSDNIYVDVVYFATMADAKRMQEAFYENEICQQFAKLIEKESVILEHYDVVSQTPCDA